MTEKTTTGIELIAAERQRQIASEGWSPFHDDTHTHGQLAVSAARYAVAHTKLTAVKRTLGQAWRWQSCWWKPKDPIRNLVRAGALIAAEIDRLQRKTDG